MTADDTGASGTPEQASGPPERAAGLPGRTSGLPEQMRIRLAKVAAIRAAGSEPYPADFPRTAAIADLRKRFGDPGPGVSTGERVGIAGRVMLYRSGGKLCFATVRDGTGDIQVMVSLDQVGEEALAAWKRDVDLGDHIGVEGEVITSRRGELSVLADSFAITAKALRPLPEKHAGLSDPESRVRHAAAAAGKACRPVRSGVAGTAALSRPDRQSGGTPDGRTARQRYQAAA